MKVIDIYGKDNCLFCARAKVLAKDLERSQGIRFFYNDVTAAVHRATLKKRMPEGVPLKTVPQIFVGNTHVGGFVEFEDAVKSGRLATLLGNA